MSQQVLFKKLGALKHVEDLVRNRLDVLNLQNFGFFYSPNLLGHPIMETFHPFGLASSAFLAFRQMVVLYK